MTMVMMTALAVTRERERGTMENLLAMPVRPLEVMIGKIIPYIVIGCDADGHDPRALAGVLFDIAIERRACPCLLLGTALFITANLAIGFTISTLAQNQLQAMQASFFIVAAVDPALGLHVPVPRHAGNGRNGWAKVMPTTHFMRIVRSVMLKGCDLRGHPRTNCSALFAIVRHRHGDRHKPLHA